MNYDEIDIFDDVTWTDPVSTTGTEILDADTRAIDHQQVRSTAFEDQSRYKKLN